MVNHDEALPTNRGAALILTKLAAPLLNIEAAYGDTALTVPTQSTDPVSCDGSTPNGVGLKVTAPQSGGHGHGGNGNGNGNGNVNGHGGDGRGFDGIGGSHGSSGKGHEFGR